MSAAGAAPQGFPAIGVDAQIGLAGQATGRPDTMGAIGPGHFVEILNRSAAVYTRGGTLLSHVTLDSFFAVRPARATAAAIVVLLVALVATTAWASKLHTMLYDNEIRQDISWLKEVIGKREALTSGSQIYQHYLGPDYKIRPVELSYDEDQIFVREKGKYRLVTEQEVAGRMVVIPSYRTKLFSREGEGIRALLGKCRRLDRSTLRVYDCSAIAPAVVQD
jgi:hypothetical protein